MRTRTSPTSMAVTAVSALAATALVAVGATSTVSAQTLTVDTLSDNPADGNTLREAIDDANTAAGLDEIVFADGLTGTITLTGGQLESTDDLSIVGPGVDELTIDGDGASRVLESSTPGASLSVRGLTIANGAVLGSGGGLAYSSGDGIFLWGVGFVGNEASNQGGGLWIANPSNDLIDLIGVDFDANRAGNAGGGLFIGDAAGTGSIQLASTSYSNNESVNGNGGGAFVSAPMRSMNVVSISATDNTATNGNAGGVWFDAADVTVFDATFQANMADDSFGGATINANVDDVTVRQSTFESNSAADSGAGNISSPKNVYVDEVTVTSNISSGLVGLQINAFDDAEVTNSVFHDNSGGTEGGLKVASATKLLVEDTSFTDNDASVAGGLFTTGIGSTAIRSSTFAGNSASNAIGEGGAIHSGITFDLDISNSTFSNNAAYDGGAVFAPAGTTVSLWHVTMVDNEAANDGGGVFVGPGGNIGIANSIVSDNTAQAFADVNDATLDIDDSILGDATGIATNGLGLIVGVDPKLGELADNGGPTLTMLPFLDSPAIDAAGSNPMMLIGPDQRGRLRTTSTPDMGSVEVFDDDAQIWVPTAPSRFVDTRAIGETIDGGNEATGAFAAGEQRQITLAGRGDVPVDAVGVIANITAVNPVGKGFITAHPCVNPRPNAASLNHSGGVNLGNEIILGLTGGDACIFTSEATDITVDVVAYITPESRYTSIDPARYADTRANGVTFDGLSQAGGAPGAGLSMSVDIAGRGDVSAAATTAVLYVAAVTPGENGFVTVWDCDTDRPLSSSLNYVTDVNRGNEIIAELSDDGGVCLYTSADADLTVDVVGFVNSGTNYESLETPSRFLDTRANGETIDGVSQAEGALGAGESIELSVGGRAGIPGIATTVVVNVTAVNPSASGFITVYDCDSLPLASSLNYVPGVNGGNEIVASLNADANVCIYTSAATDLTADVVGFTSL